jgi:hypothetical protein
MSGRHLGELRIIISTTLRHALCLTALTAQMERICQRGPGLTIRSFCCALTCEAASEYAVSFSAQIQGALSKAALFFLPE